MIRLLFISHTGNNEPPMAQCIMDHLIQKAGLTDSLSVSAASFAKEGAPPFQGGAGDALCPRHPLYDEKDLPHRLEDL